MAAAPPAMLRFRVSELVELEPFFTVGREAGRNVERCLAEAGTPLETFRSILDFGCGCGRVALWMARQMAPGAGLYGTDTDAEAIAWCRRHLAGHFSTNPPLPPLDFADSSFDLIYAVSVFTHLDEDRQFQWLRELRRVLKPGGTLLFSVHGEQAWKAIRRRDHLDALDHHGFLFTRSAKMRGICPDWYHTSYHTREYVERRIAPLFHGITYIAGGMGVQDAVAARKQQ